MINAGTPPIRYKLYTNINNSKACELEQQIINEIGRRVNQTGPLYNITSGGTGGDTFTFNPNKEKIRQKLMGRVPWNKNTKGVVKANRTSFSKNDPRRRDMVFESKRLNGIRSKSCREKMSASVYNHIPNRKKGTARSTKYCNNNLPIKVSSINSPFAT
jgi:hypothetical protein